VVQETLERTKTLVWPAIDIYLKDPTFPSQFSVPAGFEKEVNLFWQIGRDYPERKGKYLRPTALMLIAEAMGVKTEDIIPVAAAMQLSEEWILISDDIEDNSEERRGKPTLHKIHGTELAINASDGLETIMWKMIADIAKKEITEEFYRMLMRTVLGQGVEQIWTNEKRILNDEEYFFVADSKSAYYSIAGPMRLGAIFAGANDDQLNKITDFGFHLGRCFQLVDDLLDLEQDKHEGKSTLAISKGVDYVKHLAEKERDIAGQIFNSDLQFLSHNPARIQLGEIVDFILNRKY
jgi:geranylgeranyl pyrophosphate synthase